MLREKVSHGYWRTQVVVGALLLAGTTTAGATEGSLDAVDTTGNLGAAAKQINGQTNDLGGMLLSFAQVGGIAFVLAGVNDIKKNHDQPGQGMAGKGAVKIGAGVLGYFLPKVLGMGDSTIFPT